MRGVETQGELVQIGGTRVGNASCMARSCRFHGTFGASQAMPVVAGMHALTLYFKHFCMDGGIRKPAHQGRAAPAS
jgi:hypothetical protein